MIMIFFFVSFGQKDLLINIHGLLFETDVTIIRCDYLPRFCIFNLSLSLSKFLRGKLNHSSISLSLQTINCILNRKQNTHIVLGLLSFWVNSICLPNLFNFLNYILAYSALSFQLLIDQLLRSNVVNVTR